MEKWGINKELLLLPNLDGRLPEEFVQKQLARIGPPRLKCELKDAPLIPKLGICSVRYRRDKGLVKTKIQSGYN